MWTSIAWTNNHSDILLSMISTKTIFSLASKCSKSSTYLYKIYIYKKYGKGSVIVLALTVWRRLDISGAHRSFWCLISAKNRTDRLWLKRVIATISYGRAKSEWSFSTGKFYLCFHISRNPGCERNYRTRRSRGKTKKNNTAISSDNCVETSPRNNRKSMCRLPRQKRWYLAEGSDVTEQCTRCTRKAREERFVAR